MTQEGKVVLLQLESGKTLDSENFADFANRLINPTGGQSRFKGLTTSKLRGLYGMIMNVHAKINVPGDFESCKSDLQYLKARMAYEAGREIAVKEFLKETHLKEALDGVKTYEQFVVFCRYAESLVAYFKYYGGKD